MKTTIIIKDDLLKEAMKETGLKEKTAVIHYGLQEIIKSAARKRLIALGGKLKNLKTTPRRKFGI
ncbi:MAG: type II toxin-antitoxin system VapB family antitoxin [Bacteriovoracia bacterium]